jgi:hypothetical protein
MPAAPPDRMKLADPDDVVSLDDLLGGLKHHGIADAF